MDIAVWVFYIFTRKEFLNLLDLYADLKLFGKVVFLSKRVTKNT